MFHLHYRRLVGLAVFLVDDRETAEDVVQEAFEGLYRRWRRIRDPQAASAYKCVAEKRSSAFLAPPTGGTTRRS
jgi:DNA-directed RNA polymerase specialized sigma24 family protein